MTRTSARFDISQIAEFARVNMNGEAIKREFHAGRPPILLVNCRPIGGEAFGHYVVVTGYASRGFWLHDPYERGKDVYLTTEQLDTAQTQMSGIASFPDQAVVLTQ